MGRIVKSIIMAVVVTALVIVTAGTIAIAAGSTFTLGGTAFTGLLTAGATGSALFSGALLTAMTTSLAIAGAGALVTSLLAPKMNSGMDGSGANLGAKVSQGGNVSARQIIYGKCRVGGTFAHIETSGTDGAFLNMIIVTSGHPVAGFEKVFYNDLELVTLTATQNGETVYYAYNNDIRNL